MNPNRSKGAAWRARDSMKALSARGAAIIRVDLLDQKSTETIAPRLRLDLLKGCSGKRTGSGCGSV